MALVDYSDSDSESESEQQTEQPPPKPTPSASSSTSTQKKPFQKLIDRSADGTAKIRVHLPSAGAEENDDQQPPAKRARTIGASSGPTSRFSNFSSFLPPPKKPAAPAPSASKKPAAAPFQLRTAAEPAFQRGSAFDDDDGDDMGGGGSGLNLPPPKRPTIPEGQKPADEVKLVGKPLMFKPLSVMRKGAGKKKATPTGAGKAAPAPGTAAASGPSQQEVKPAPPPPPAKKKMSLFSTDDDDEPRSKIPDPTPEAEGPYEPIYSLDDFSQQQPPPEEEDTVTSEYSSYHPPPPPPPQQQETSFSSLTQGLNLSAASQRDLFGRNSSAFSSTTNARIVNFNMEQEYAANEALRASGEQQTYNPVRAIAPGKHSLRQVVSMAQNNQDALEDSFVQGRVNRKDAAGRYGWK